MSSKNYHWTRWIADTYLLLDTCPNLNMSSDNFHRTQALPIKKLFTTSKFGYKIYVFFFFFFVSRPPIKIVAAVDLLY